MRELFVTVAAAALASLTPALAATATFDSGDEGFGLTGGVLTAPSSGGNPGGYLDIDDTAAGLMQLIFPQVFVDAVADGAVLSFDAISFEGGSGVLSEFGIVSLSNGSDTITADAFAPTPAPSSMWTQGGLTFDAATFGVTQSEFLDVLNGLVSLTMVVERNNVIDERVGIDNVSIDPVPLPAAALLFLPVAGGMLLRGRKR
ncbi:MAG: hypothetical protein AAFR65_02455 [Pseudomonadota bacterium]